MDWIQSVAKLESDSLTRTHAWTLTLGPGCRTHAIPAFRLN